MKKMNNHKRQKGTKELVKDIFEEHPDWNAPQIYDRYLILIGDPQKAVGLNAIQKHLEPLKPHVQQIIDGGVDKPWHLGVLKEHPELFKDCTMSAEAISHILEVKREMPENIFLPPSMTDPENFVIVSGIKLTAIRYHMTVRDARWVSRLYAIKNLSNAELLRTATFVYSLLEISSELTDSPLDTSEADEIISHKKNKKEIEDELQHYFQRLPKGLWFKLLQAIADTQKNLEEEGEVK